MYEANEGAKRFIYAASRHTQDDPGKLRQLAALLNYQPEQLSEDIQAAVNLADNTPLKGRI